MTERSFMIGAGLFILGLLIGLIFDQRIQKRYVDELHSLLNQSQENVTDLVRELNVCTAILKDANNREALIGPERNNVLREGDIWIDTHGKMFIFKNGKWVAM